MKKRVFGLLGILLMCFLFLGACGKKDLGSASAFSTAYDKVAFKDDPLVQLGTIEKNGTHSHQFKGVDVRTKTKDNKLIFVAVTGTEYSEYSVPVHVALKATEKALKISTDNKDKISKKLNAKETSKFKAGDIYVEMISAGDDFRSVSFSIEK